MKVLSSSLLPLLLAVSSSTVQLASSCVVPQGIDDGIPGSLDSSALTLPPAENPLGVFGSLIVESIPELTTYETPIGFRVVQLINLGVWNTAAAFHPTSLDYFARVDISNERRRCSVDPDDAAAVAMNTLQRKVTLAYAFKFGVEAFLPAIIDIIDSKLVEFGLDPNICSSNHGIGGSDESDCLNGITTPWGLAYTFVADSKKYANNDGWNADGSLSGKTYNRVPYEDWRSSKTKYVPTPKRNSWVPLEENNGKGYIVSQYHVTPHIGQTAKSVFLGDERVCALEVSTEEDPSLYDYKEEMELVLERSANLATSDVQKMEVELFDGKLTSVLPLLVQYYIRSGYTLDDYEFIFADTILIAALYEATIVVWKEKVRFDLIRPPTIIHRDLQDTLVTAYAGPYQGLQTFPANEWQPYIRTMPHAEFPSGSACICEASNQALQSITGLDSFTDATGLAGPPALVLEVPEGSSKLEPGSVPSDDLNLLFSSWSEMSSVCGQSRLNGGMHFTTSVPAGADLCAPIGGDIYDAFVAIRDGQVPDYVLDIDDSSPISEVRCGPPSSFK